MPYSVEYFHPRVLAEIEAWPSDVLADYARLLELLMEHGPNLRLPHSRAFGDGIRASTKGAFGHRESLLLFSAQPPSRRTPRLCEEVAADT